MATLLVTNDDGIASLLWQELCTALEAAGHTVYGIAPQTDQSWIATAMTVRGTVTATPLGTRRWAVSGTPADCVGIASALTGASFDTVISGINIGVNTRLPLILASGTVGAASAGAMLGLKAIAFSWACPRDIAADAKKAGGILPQTKATADAMVAHCVSRVAKLLTEEAHFGRVYNINFPAAPTATTPWQTAPMALHAVEHYFEKISDTTFKHNPKLANKSTGSTPNEFSVLGTGAIAESIIDWPKVGL